MTERRGGRTGRSDASGNTSPAAASCGGGLWRQRRLDRSLHGSTLVDCLMLLTLFESWLRNGLGLQFVDRMQDAPRRALLGAMLAFVVTLWFGRRAIRWLRSRYREPIKIAAPEVARLHASKQSTPTMGGLFLVASFLAALALVGDWSHPYTLLSVATVVALALVGAGDDLIKLRTSAAGLSVSTKLVAQTAIGLAVGLALFGFDRHDDGSWLAIPFTEYRWELGWWYVPFSALVIVGASNAVNLSDGLDGLAGGCTATAMLAMAAVLLACGSPTWSAMLNLPFVAGAQEAAVVAAAMSGAVLAFLWFNCHPASVFMGDTGSLPLGGLLGLLAVIARQELLLLAIGGVLVVEALSVIAQVAFFRCTRRRLIRCAPLHHHFQLLGWPEDKIVVRFWIASACCAVLGLAGLAAQSTGEPQQPPTATFDAPALQLASDALPR